MIAFLKSGELPVPQAVAMPPTGVIADAGFVIPNFGQGTVLLKDVDGKFHRLVWADAAEKDRRRALRPGVYAITGYTVTRADSNGKDWHVAGTGRMIGKLKVETGTTQAVKLADAIHLKLQAKRSGDTLLITADVQGEHHCGLSIYRDGKRIPLDWRVTGGNQQILASGTIEYG